MVPLRFVSVCFVLALVIGSIVIGANAAVASPNTRWVNDDDPNGGLYLPPGTSCDNPGYATVQSAVTAAMPGDRINVCPGTYIEEVTIPDSKDSIQLRSVKRWQAVIKAPPLMNPLGTKSIVRVNGAQDVTILAFTIAGPGGGGCDSLRYGVRVDDGGSADILGNHIIDIRDEPFSGCQNGVAVLVGRQSEMTTGTARIIGNVIERYQKNGPTVGNTNSYAEIAHNIILGIGPTALIAQNGVQVAGGAAADVRHNFVSGHIYTPQTVTSTGVLIFGSGVVNVDHNTITSNDVGEYTSSNSAPSTVQHNRIRASTFDGAFAESTTNQRVVKNKTEENTGPGIGLYDSQNNVINDNHVKDNADGGILLYAGGPSTNNMVSDNKVRDNGSDAADTTDGIRVEAGQIGNVFDGNHLRDNLTHDCHDMNATGNTWTNNKGETSVPPGICGKDDDESSFATSTAFGWDASYPWYVDMGVAEFDWAAAYATIDTNSLLQVLPQLGLGTRGRASPHR